MNKVEIDLVTYNELYDNSKEYRKIQFDYEESRIKSGKELLEREEEIKRLTNEIDGFLLNCLKLESHKYLDSEICNFNIDSEKIAKYITEKYLEKANNLFEGSNK